MTLVTSLRLPQISELRRHDSPSLHQLFDLSVRVTNRLQQLLLQSTTQISQQKA
jgi:hypothetical protein